MYHLFTIHILFFSLLFSLLFLLLAVSLLISDAKSFKFPSHGREEKGKAATRSARNASITAIHTNTTRSASPSSLGPSPCSSPPILESKGRSGRKRKYPQGTAAGIGPSITSDSTAAAAEDGGSGGSASTRNNSSSSSSISHASSGASSAGGSAAKKKRGADRSAGSSSSSSSSSSLVASGKGSQNDARASRSKDGKTQDRTSSTANSCELRPDSAETVKGTSNKSRGRGKGKKKGRGRGGGSDGKRGSGGGSGGGSTSGSCSSSSSSSHSGNASGSGTSSTGRKLKRGRPAGVSTISKIEKRFHHNESEKKRQRRIADQIATIKGELEVRLLGDPAVFFFFLSSYVSFSPYLSFFFLFFFSLCSYSSFSLQISFLFLFLRLLFILLLFLF